LFAEQYAVAPVERSVLLVQSDASGQTYGEDALRTTGGKRTIPYEKPSGEVRTVLYVQTWKKAYGERERLSITGTNRSYSVLSSPCCKAGRTVTPASVCGSTTRQRSGASGRYRRCCRAGARQYSLAPRDSSHRDTLSATAACRSWLRDK